MRVPKDGEKKKSPRMMAHLWKHHEEAREYPLDLDGKPRARIEERGASALRRGPSLAGPGKMLPTMRIIRRKY